MLDLVLIALATEYLAEQFDTEPSDYLTDEQREKMRTALRPHIETPDEELKEIAKQYVIAKIDSLEAGE